MGIEWATVEVFERLFTDNFDVNGFIKSDSVPVLAKGTFAVVFKSEDVVGSKSAAGYVVRVAVSPPGPDQEFAFQKELQALVAYLKLTSLDPEPKHNTVVAISNDMQPSGLCKVYCYYVLAKASSRVVITVMPLGKPLIDVIEEELIAASEQPGEQQPRQTDVVVTGMSQLAMGLKGMHEKNIYWRDCKVDNVVIVDGNTEIIDINSGVCTVGYASHEQLNKLDLSKADLRNNQKVTDAMERVLASQPDHQTWVTQDVFALSIVILEWLTFGMFTYPYNREEASPSYAQLLLFELEVYNLLLAELSDVYDVTVLKGRLDRKMAHWKGLVDERIDPTSQRVRDLTLWPLAVTDFKRDRRLFDLWAALAFWDHIDHRFGFIGHWSDWYFNFQKHSGIAPALAGGGGASASGDDGGGATAAAAAAASHAIAASAASASAEPSPPKPTAPAPGPAMASSTTTTSAASTAASAPHLAAPPSATPATPATPATAAAAAEAAQSEAVGEVTQWAARAGHQDMCAIQVRIHARKEHAEEEHTGRVVRRLASLTKRMDSLNASLGAFWSESNGGAAARGSGGGGGGGDSNSSCPGKMLAPCVRVVYSSPHNVRAAVMHRQLNADVAQQSPVCQKTGGPRGSTSSIGGEGALTRLLEVRLRLALPKNRQDLQVSMLQALGKKPSPLTAPV